MCVYIVCIYIKLLVTLYRVLFLPIESQKKKTRPTCVSLLAKCSRDASHTRPNLPQLPVIKKVNIYLLSFPQLVTRIDQGAKGTAGGILTDILPLFILRICRFSKSTISRAISFLSPLPPLVFHWLWVFVDW